MIRTSDNITSYLQELLTLVSSDDAPSGGSLVVFREGECIAEVSTGVAQTQQPWSADTLSLNYSTGKGVLATLVHVLVSNGILDYDQPIAQYWPDFAANGKQDITLREVLTHQAGLFDIAALVEDSLELLKWDTMLVRIAAMPIAPPILLGSAAKRRWQKTHPEAVSKDQPPYYQSVYSALVFGWVIGGLIEQATKARLAAVLRQYLTEPLGIEKACYFGVPTAQLDQVARLPRNFTVPLDRSDRASFSDEQKQALFKQFPAYSCWQARAEALGIAKQHDLTAAQINRLYFDPRLMDLEGYKSALSPRGETPVNYHSTEVLQGCIPAANGVASAKALATIYAMLANQGIWQGNTLIDAATFAQLSRIHVTGMDAVMPAVGSPTDPAIASMHWRLGYHRLPSACHDTSHAFGHMGYNGSVAWCDPSRGLAVAYVHNHNGTMFSDIRQFALNEAILSLCDS